MRAATLASTRTPSPRPASVSIRRWPGSACLENVAFAYVNAFTARAAVGFFHGSRLPDRFGWLEGSGRRMRHVKLRPGDPIDGAALAALIEPAYSDMRAWLPA